MFVFIMRVPKGKLEKLGYLDLCDMIMKVGKVCLLPWIIPINIHTPSVLTACTIRVNIFAKEIAAILYIFDIEFRGTNNNYNATLLQKIIFI